ncbi:MAG: thioesterase family protein [Nitrososphaerales archaeon]
MRSYEGTTIRVRFHDTDHSGRVYFSNYVNWMDDDITEFFRSKGIVFADIQKTIVDSESVEGTFVIGEFSCRIHAPSKFDDILKIKSKVAELRAKVIRFESEVLDANTDARLATGSITYIWVIGKSSAPIPEQIVKRLQS